MKVAGLAVKAPADKGPSSVKVCGRGASHTREPAHESFSCVQVFGNPISLDCDTAKAQSGAQTVALTAEQLTGGSRVELRFVLFQKVTALGLFFPANHEGAPRQRGSRGAALLRRAGFTTAAETCTGGEQTVVERLSVFGTPVPQVRPLAIHGSFLYRHALLCAHARKGLPGRATRTSRRQLRKGTGLARARAWAKTVARRKLAALHEAAASVH